jgi:glycolate oxidase iron-sulfur subunit
MGWYDAEDAPARADLRTCIHCGLCLTACPTYRELKIEPDSPRGRIYLMRGLAEGRIAPSDELVGHLDLCLDCRACETVCPAGVPYSRMLEEARGQLERRRPAGGAGRSLGRLALTVLFPNRGLMHATADALRLAQSGPLAAAIHALRARRWLPGFAARGLDLTPALVSRAARRLEAVASRLPAGGSVERRADALVFRPASTPKARVGFFTSCVMDVMFPATNQEAVRLLVLAGAEVVVPSAQTCCGALHAHSGLRREAKRLARRNVSAFASGFDRVVTDSAGCGAALREVGHWLDASDAAGPASEFSGRVRDVSEVLAELGLPTATAMLSSPRDASRPFRVAYHDPCHLAHAQKVRAQPRALLAALPGVQLVDLPNSDWCCGSAGVYNLTHADMADAQLEHKLDSIDAVDPDVVVASNPGCLLHMARGAHGRGSQARVVHLVEVLALAHPAAPAAAMGLV